MARRDSNTKLFAGLNFTKTGYKRSERQQLIFTLTNESDKELRVLKWFTPLEGFKSDMFNVEVAGKPVTYMGRLYKRGAPTDEDYITLQHGKSVQVRVDLSEAYDIAEAGAYRVKYKIGELQAGPEEPGVLRRKFVGRQRGPTAQVKSNVAIFTLLHARRSKTVNGIDRSALNRLAREKRRRKAAKAPAFSNCSRQRQVTLQSALTEAINYASRARDALTGASYCGRFSAPRYTEWFGISTKARFDTVVSHYTRIADALSNQTITFNCGGAGCDPGDFAFVFPTKPYEIHLCSAFWTAPLTGTDSKGGTLVHEMSHFDVVAGTDDHAYGQVNCRQLAKDNPTNAIDNADSHEYFAENDPALSMAPLPTPVNVISGPWRNLPAGFKGSFDAALNGAGPFAGSCYFFKGSNYIRYDWVADRADSGYPRNIAQNWHNLPAGFTDNFEAAINGQGPFAGKCYFFKGNNYIRYDWAADRADSGYPKNIAQNWHNLPAGFTGNFDAIINGNGPFAGKCYFFKGDFYIRYDWNADRTDPGYPKRIADVWNCLPPEFFGSYDAAVEGDRQFSDRGYFFKGNNYIRYYWDDDRAG